MPNVICTKCRSTLAIPDDAVGKMVQCASCQNVFAGVVALPPTERPKRRDEEDDEDRPSRRKSTRRSRDEDEDEDDDRPSRRKRSRRDEDDDEDFEEPAAKPTNGLAVASLVLGILAVVLELPSFGGTVLGAACCGFCGLLFWPGHGIAALLAIIGGILGLTGMKNPAGKGLWITGLILSGLTLLLAITSILLNMLGIAVQASNLPPPNQPAGVNKINPPIQQPIKPRR